MKRNGEVQKKSVVLHVRFDEVKKEMLDAKAEELGLSTTDVVKMAVAEYLKK